MYQRKTWIHITDFVFMNKHHVCMYALIAVYNYNNYNYSDFIFVHVMQSLLKMAIHNYGYRNILKNYYLKSSDSLVKDYKIM